MKVTVVGGTGTVGSQVVRELLARDAQVTVLTRDPRRIRPLPPGVRSVTGDLIDSDTARMVFVDADAAFLLNAVSTTEAHEGLMAVNGARLAGVARLAYLSVTHLEQAPHLPHFGAKLAIEAAIKASGIAYTILRPNNFYQNDYWYKEALLGQGVYPQPIGDIGVSRIDVRDIAEAAAIALTTGGHEGQVYELGGPQAHTGESTAAIWSRVLDRPVAYAGNDLDAWEQQARALLPTWMAFDFRLMYEHFQQQGLKTTPAALQRLTRLLGHPPRRFEDFASETFRAWQA